MDFECLLIHHLCLFVHIEVHMDVLAEILDSVKMHGDVFLRCAFAGPWIMEIGQKKVAEFHLIVAGHCYIAIQGFTVPVCLEPGDIVLFPNGHAHVLLDSPDTQASDASLIAPETLPENLELLTVGEGTEPVSMLCGYFSFDHAGHSALMQALPDFIHIKGELLSGDFPWLKNTVEFINFEAEHFRPGTSAVINRLVEVLFVQILRAYITTSNQSAGLLGAIADVRLGRALKAMHKTPEHAWTLEMLANRAGMSRSAFAAGFLAQVGQTPMQYLTEWRMHKAKTMLQGSHSGIGDIAERCGYQSESSFSKAFKKQFGVSPGSFRKTSK
ncbi:MAG: hypothetical protein AUK36_07640 [Zetaproteobacteria bacterium CG2_30_59_37]|nr:MAG: hypothetical protein AUK36_07640 [Zetaproteobacteria bacterium CG2_30_59_37]